MGVRHEETTELVCRLANDNVILEPYAGAQLQGKLSKGESLNAVLRRLYPSGAAVLVTDLVAVLDSDQVCAAPVVLGCVPAQSVKGSSLSLSCISVRRCQAKRSLPPSFHT